MTKKELRKEFYAVMEYSEPFGNEYHDELFDWCWSKLEEKEEVSRMQLTAISVASMCNTESSLSEQRIPKDNPYWTPSYEQVIEAAKREISLIAKLKAADEVIETMQTYIGSISGRDITFDKKAFEDSEQAIVNYKSLKP